MFLGFHSNTAQDSYGPLVDISRCFATLHRPCCAPLTWPPWQITGKCSSRKTTSGNILALDLRGKRPCFNNCTGNTSLFLGFVQKQTLFQFLFPNKMFFKLQKQMTNCRLRTRLRPWKPPSTLSMSSAEQILGVWFLSMRKILSVGSLHINLHPWRSRTRKMRIVISCQADISTFFWKNQVSVCVFCLTNMLFFRVFVEHLPGPMYGLSSYPSPRRKTSWAICCKADA